MMFCVIEREYNVEKGGCCCWIEVNIERELGSLLGSPMLYSILYICICVYIIMAQT